MDHRARQARGRFVGSGLPILSAATARLRRHELEAVQIRVLPLDRRFCGAISVLHNRNLTSNPTSVAIFPTPVCGDGANPKNHGFAATDIVATAAPDFGGLRADTRSTPTKVFC
jgi:hypothetical protein